MEARSWPDPQDRQMAGAGPTPPHQQRSCDSGRVRHWAAAVLLAKGNVMKTRPAGGPGRPPRFVIGFFTWSWDFRPRGYHTGTWIMIPPVWIRLGRRKYWETEMITPVKPLS